LSFLGLDPKTIFILAGIGAAAVILSVVSYSYSVGISELTTKSAIDSIHLSAASTSSDLAEIMKFKIGEVTHSLNIMAIAPSIQDQDVQLARSVFTTAQESTSDLTNNYFWIDANGKLLWATAFENEATYQQFVGADRSNREYYTEPMETKKPVVTSVIESIDGVPRIYIAQPILSSDGSDTFKGVIVASANTDVVGEFLKSKISPSYQGTTTGMLEKSGIILFSEDTTAIGLDVFGDEFQSRMPEDLKPSFNAFLERSLQGKSGVEDLSYQGNSGTLAYSPININDETWAVVYVVVPHAFAGNIANSIENQRNLSTGIMIAIGAMAVVISLVVLIWNRNLHRTVDARTHELKQSNESLMESNQRLEGAYKKLQDQDLLQREFVNIAAHELRTPIQPIMSIVEMALDDANQREPDSTKIEIAREDLQALGRNAQRLERLSSDLLHVARIESNTLKVQKEDFDLNEKIRNVIKDIRLSFVSDRNLHANGSTKLPEIRFIPSEEKIMINGDKTKIFEVVSNLLRNAVRFANAGTITISSSVNSDGMAVVTVRDDGTGIDPQMLPDLFSKFKTKKDTGGTGLGLYIAKSMIEAHHGTIWGEDNKDGSGATFGFSLPALQRKQELVKTAPDELSSPTETSASAKSFHN
jgi:signal transduction histidine kinase